MWLFLNGRYRKLCWTAQLSRTLVFTVCATSLSLNRCPPDQNRSSSDWNASVTTQLTSKLSLSTMSLTFFSFQLMMRIMAFQTLSQGLQNPSWPLLFVWLHHSSFPWSTLCFLVTILNLLFFLPVIVFPSQSVSQVFSGVLDTLRGDAQVLWTI